MGEARLMNANCWLATSRDEQPDDLARSGVAADRISLRADLIKRNITPNGWEPENVG
jgi:hypothetical protein